VPDDWPPLGAPAVLPLLDDDPLGCPELFDGEPDAFPCEPPSPPALPRIALSYASLALLRHAARSVPD